MLRRLRVPVLLLSLITLRPATAQRWEPAPSVTRLAWGSVNVLVQADSTQGIRLWAHTSSLGYDGRPLAFVASFDPELLGAWLNRADAVLTRTPPPVADSVQGLVSPPLLAQDSSQLVVVRRRSRGKWAKRASLLLIGPSNDTPWSIDASLEDAGQLLRALFVRAAESRFQPDSTTVIDANPMVPGTCPWPLPGNPLPKYPYLRDGARRTGEVWMTFIVLPDGSPDSGSFRVLLSDDPAFSEAAYRALKDSRYRPGTLRDRPIAMRVFQRVTFRAP